MEVRHQARRGDVTGRPSPDAGATAPAAGSPTTGVRRSGGALFYWLVKSPLRPLFKVLFRPHVSGEHHVPPTGGALLASNHLSMCDSLFLPVMTRRRMSFLAKSEYFTGKGIKGRAKAAFVRGTGLIPIDRENADAAAAALQTGAGAVSRGTLLGVYP